MAQGCRKEFIPSIRSSLAAGSYRIIITQHLRAAAMQCFANTSIAKRGDSILVKADWSRASSAEHCSIACQRDAGCRVASFDGAMCYFFSGEGQFEAVLESGWTSCYKGESIRVF